MVLKIPRRQRGHRKSVASVMVVAAVVGFETGVAWREVVGGQGGHSRLVVSLMVVVAVVGLETGVAGREGAGGQGGRSRSVVSVVVVVAVVADCDLETGLARWVAVVEMA